MNSSLFRQVQQFVLREITKYTKLTASAVGLFPVSKNKRMFH